jgi:flagellar protein FlbD
MITVTRLDERVVVVNAELIKMIESTPDTIITLINGDSLIVRESVDEVVRRSIDYARQIRGFQVV